MNAFDIKLNKIIAPEALRDLYLSAPLANRPTTDLSLLKKMLEHANLVISCWKDSQLIGVCRAFSDFSYVTYVSDLAIHADYQNKGIGRSLLDHTKKESGLGVKIVLLSAPSANSYYEKLNFISHPRAWVHENKENISC